MKTIKNIIFVIAALSCTVSCEEFEPVFTGKYPDSEYQEPVNMDDQVTHTIAEVAAMYKIGKQFIVDSDIIIKGVISTTDRPGNFYKSFYIQDETGGMEIKVGKNGLYNDYKPGQTVYINLNGLCVGMYGYKSGSGNGMVQIGLEDYTGLYETAYIETTIVVDNHIFKGAEGDLVEPVELTESQLPSSNATLATCKYLGQLVTLKGLRYANEIFVLMYLNSNKNKKDADNRIFLSEGTFGVTTWAMSESKMKEYLYKGYWDSCRIGSGNELYDTVGDRKGDGTYPDIEKAAYSVSQYFTMGNKEIQIRTSGYSKFCDAEIDPAVLSGEKTIDVTGILTLYQGSIQFIVNDITDIKVND